MTGNEGSDGAGVNVVFEDLVVLGEREKLSGLGGVQRVAAIET